MKSNVYGGKGNQGPGDISFHKHNHGIAQGLSHRNMPPDTSSQKCKKYLFAFHSYSQFPRGQPCIKIGYLATCLRCMNVNVTLDFFDYDNPPGSWPLWYERKINVSKLNVVLHVYYMYTEKFYDQLTNSS